MILSEKVCKSAKLTVQFLKNIMQPAILHFTKKFSTIEKKFMETI